MCFLKLGDKINKRLGAMHKLTNVVHSGWMTKSPPEQKLQSPLKIFRAKWKQRFFVLHKPSGSLPDQYEFSYYNSEQCSKKKGSIDLDQCEQIIESLDSDQYPYLLAIKTVCKGKVRTYYLATNSEEDMTSWVQCLCRVCGLKQEDTPTDIPDPRLSLHGLSVSSSPPSVSSGTVRSTATATPTVTSPPVQAQPSRAATVSSSTSSNNSQPPPSTSPQSYVLLNECTSGISEKRSDRYGRTDSIDSVPEYQAPPPPAKKGNQLLNNNTRKENLHDSVFDVYDHPPTAGGQESYDRPPRSDFPQELYDRPRSGEFRGSGTSLDDDNVYKIPPSAGGQASLLRVTRNSTSSDTVDLHAAVPLPMPRPSPRSTRSSLSDRPDSLASMGRPMTENYDIPPPRPGSSSSHDGGGSTSTPPTPPQRPPKPHSLMPQSPYQNLPSNSKLYENNSLSAVPSAPPKNCAAALSYDVPRASTVISPPRDSSALDIAPPAPAPRQCGPSAGHSYLNTVPGLNNSPAVPPLPETYMKNGEKGDADLAYADMDGTPPTQRKHPTDKTYSDMSGAGGGGGQDLYQVPPVAPRNPGRSGTMPVQRTQGGAAAGPDMEAHFIWSNTRTKSFKRNNQVNASPIPVRPPPLEPRRPLLPSRMEFVSSSEDDDELSVDGNNTHHDLSVVRMSTVPAPPDLDTEPELKYLDLALDTPPDPSRPQAAAPHGTPTEYREIDFVKTRALQDTKKERINKMNK